MKLFEYIKTQTFPEGFPQGDTFLELDKIDAEQVEFVDDAGHTVQRTRLKLADGAEYYCARTVMKDLAAIIAKGGKKARVTRVGAGKNDTRYTVVEIK